MNELQKALAGNVGVECYVSDTSERAALANKNKRCIFAFVNDKYIGRDNNYDYAMPIPEKKIAPFTTEAFPKGMVWITHFSWGGDIRMLVTSVNPNTVSAGQGETFTYESLIGSGFKISLDGGKTWQVAGVES